MTKFLKYLAIFCAISLLASLTFLGFALYQAISTANRYFAGADDYTCRQFVYDLDHDETDKMLPIILATAAYGKMESVSPTFEESIRKDGITPAARKVYAACKVQPGTRVINLFAAEITGSPTIITAAAAGVSVSTITSTTTKKGM
jgi:hypothetical protein